MIVMKTESEVRKEIDDIKRTAKNEERLLKKAEVKKNSFT